MHNDAATATPPLYAEGLYRVESAGCYAAGSREAHDDPCRATPRPVGMSRGDRADAGRGDGAGDRPLPTHPRFQLRWLARPGGADPAWLADLAVVPPGAARVYANAKSGLYALIDDLEADDGTVLLPGAIPSGVVATVAACGFDAAYYPVAEDFSVDVDTVAARIAATAPEVVLFVHYLGFASPAFEELLAVARDADALVVEDCSRAAFGRDPAGRLLGSRGDAAVFSLHKVLPVPNGGLVVHRAGSLPAPTGRVSELRSVGGLALLALSRRVPGPPLAGVVRDCLGGADGADPGDGSDPLDAFPTVWPPLAPALASAIGLRRCDPVRVRRRRRHAYDALRPRLAALDDVTVVTPPAYAGASPYGVGVLFRDAAAARETLAALRARGLPAETFGWHGPPADVATSLDRLVVLPTHQQLPASAAPRVADCIAASLATDAARRPE